MITLDETVPEEQIDEFNRLFREAVEALRMLAKCQAACCCLEVGFTREIYPHLEEARDHVYRRGGIRVKEKEDSSPIIMTAMPSIDN